MSTKRLHLFAILSLFLLNTIPTILSSQSNFSLEDTDINAFITHIECEFEEQIGITRPQIQDFLNNLPISNNASSCLPPEPTIFLNTIDEIKFTWAAIGGAQNYLSASLGLGDGTVDIINETTPKAHFTNLSPQLYLFAFITECLSASSILNVIIVDKDLSFGLPPNYDLSCDCLTTSPFKKINGNDDCDSFFEAISFSWNNKCYANKYKFRIAEESEEGNYEEEFYVISEVTESSSTVYVLNDCNPLIQYDEETYTLLDENKFSAILTTEGIHFYFIDTELTSPNVSRTTCDCFDSPFPPKANIRDGSKTDGIFADLQVNPNPFDEAINISLEKLSASNTEILIFDLSGRIVYQKQYQTAEDHFSINISTQSLAQGIYQLYLKNDNQVWQQKIVKMK